MVTSSASLAIVVSYLVLLIVLMSTSVVISITLVVVVTATSTLIVPTITSSEVTPFIVVLSIPLIVRPHVVEEWVSWFTLFASAIFVVFVDNGIRVLQRV